MQDIGNAPPAQSVIDARFGTRNHGRTMNTGALLSTRPCLHNASRRMILLAGALAALLPGFVPAASAPPTLADYRATYEREMGKIRTNNAPVVAINNDYTKVLDALHADFKKRGDFDNTMALIAERKRFEATRMVSDKPPADLPPAIFKAQADYRAALVRVETERDKQIAKLNASYAKALKELIKTYLAADKMAEAEAANKEMRRAEAELKWAEETLKAAGVVADRPAPPPAAPAPVITPAPGGSPDEAAGRLANNKVLPAGLRKGLILYYSFDGDDGGKVSDASDKHNNGIVHGAAWTDQGRIGGAYDFNGHDAYISGPNVLTGFRRFTILAWVNLRTVTHADYMGVWGQQEFERNDRAYSFFTGTRVFGSSAIWEDGSSPMETRTQHPLSRGAWHLIAQTYDGTAIRQYDNGALVNTVRDPGKSLGNKQDFAIGRVVAYSGRPLATYFDGLIDEVMVWDRSLSEAELGQLYRRKETEH